MREPGPGAVCSPAEQAKLEELMSTMYVEEDYRRRVHPRTGSLDGGRDPAVEGERDLPGDRRHYAVDPDGLTAELLERPAG